MKTIVYANPSIFEPDTLLPSQVDHTRHLTGEQALLEAHIEVALQDVEGRATGIKHGKFASYALAQEAHDWFCSNSEEPFSFLWCCAHLHIEPLPIRHYAEETFAHLSPPVKKAPTISAYPQTQQAYTRRLQNKPFWLTRVTIRHPSTYGNHGRILKVVNLQSYHWTKAEADVVARDYIKSGAWKAHLPQPEQEAA